MKAIRSRRSSVDVALPTDCGAFHEVLEKCFRAIKFRVTGISGLVCACVSTVAAQFNTHYYMYFTL